MSSNRNDPHFQWSRKGPVVIFQIKGTVLQTHNPELENKLYVIESEGLTDLLVDFTKLHHISSSALGALTQFKKKLNSRGGDLRIVVNDEDLSEVFEITGLDKIFKLFYNVEEGLKSFQE